MVQKSYDWVGGAALDEHSRRKHKILAEYFHRYLTVRCQLPQQTRFRLALVDGFAGGGRYRCGSPGSPLLFIEGLAKAHRALNVQRAANGFAKLEIECLFVFNDYSREAIETLKANVAPVLAALREQADGLHIRVEYQNETFENVYPIIKQAIVRRNSNVIFNLDQCGHSHVEQATLRDIMRSFVSAEVFYTFVVDSLLAFLRKSDPEALAAQLVHVGIDPAELASFDQLMTRTEWLGAAERLVFDAFGTCGTFVSPFSINNPAGWRYWLIHFASSYRARQVYNNVLHDNASMQAHFGRSGLNMLSYDPRHETGSLYLFDPNGRADAVGQLMSDIPRLISKAGDAMSVSDFYESIYNTTPAHSEDINKAIIGNPDIEVVTPAGGERRSATTIRVDDVLRLKRQSTFFPMLGLR